MINEPDIVERLRNHVNHRNGPSLLNGEELMMLDAAAEITKLRAETEDLLNAAEHFRAERDAAAREMRERCADIAEARRAATRAKAKACKAPSQQSWFARSIEAAEIAQRLRALPSTKELLND
jgi:hypothetical protein